LRSLSPWPRVTAARGPCPRVSPSPLAAAACWTPHVSATVLLLHAMLNHRATGGRQRWQRRARGHARGMPLFPLLRRTHATPCTPLDASLRPDRP
jgi:hypothetical protein